MNKDAFAGFHPVVNMMYFTVVVVFSMFFTHPACLGASLVCAVAYSVYLNGRKAVRFTLVFMLPMLMATAMLNPLFNHEGSTILAYLPDGNPLTLESMLYGVAAATMLVTVISWFSCLNAVMTTDKFVYLFGRIAPALSLMLAMALRFVPRFKVQLKVIADAQKCVGRNASDGNLLQKARHGIRMLSIMVTWALENAIETADSMKSRGYGLPGRTAFSIYRFDKRDRTALAFILACATYVAAGAVTGGLYFRYFPTINGVWGTPYAISIFISHLALGAVPVILNFREDLVWKSIALKA
ncbi:MAG: energy-coupling factor transporter transmembrane protein EcfT [Clostridiales bacterium]|nr:energy-coupling factor transporter transmembrane protein EcfT [Clostridiales bacterium]